MQKENLQEDKNINRRNFLKKLTMSAVFTVPTIQSFKLLATTSNWWWWTGHHHHHIADDSRPVPPPPPSSTDGSW